MIKRLVIVLTTLLMFTAVFSVAKAELPGNLDRVTNNDGDTLPDAWENFFPTGVGMNDLGDQDGDGVTNLNEYLYGGYPNMTDTDSDGMPDSWEYDYGFYLNSSDNINDDPDGDFATNLEEYTRGTDPTVPNYGRIRIIISDFIGNPVKGVLIYINNSLIGTTSESGILILTNKLPGDYQITANGSAVKFNKTLLVVTVPIELTLTQPNLILDTVEIYIEPNTRIADVGINKNFTINITNRGTSTKTFNIANISGNASYSNASLSQTSVTNLASGASDTSTALTVDSSYVGNYNFTVVVTSGTDSDVTSNRTVYLGVTATPGGSVITDSNIIGDDPTSSIITSANITSSTISDSAVINSNVTGNSTLSSDTVVQDYSIVENTTLSSTTATNSTLSDSSCSGSIITNTLVNTSICTSSTVVDSVLENSVIETSTLSDIEAENVTIINDNLKTDTVSSGRTAKLITRDVEFNLTSDTLTADVGIGALITGYNSTEFISQTIFPINISDDTTAEAAIEIIASTGSSSITPHLVVAKTSISPAKKKLSNNPSDYVSITDKNKQVGGVLEWNYIKINYDQDDVDDLNLDENTLTVMYFDGTDWVARWCPDSPSGDCIASGRDTTNNYVWANVSHFSVYGLQGSIISSAPPTTTPRSTGGGGGAIISSIELGKLASEFNILTPKILGSILGGKTFEGKQFYTSTPYLAAPLILVGLLPTPTLPLLQTLMSTPQKIPLYPKISRGVELLSEKDIEDIHNFVGSKVLEKYSYTGTIIIARRNPPADSMAAVAYANYIDAPILLTEEKKLPAATYTTIKMLRTPNIVIVGGPVAVTKNPEDELKEISSVERIWGEDRYETAVEIADKIPDPEVIIITDGTNPPSDALYVAIQYNAPMVYVNGISNVMPDTTRSYLLNHKKTKSGQPVKWVVVGLDEGMSSELQALYSLPEFLTKYGFARELYKLGSSLF